MAPENWSTLALAAALFAGCHAPDDPVPAADNRRGVGDDGDTLLPPQAAIEAIPAAHAAAARQLNVVDVFFTGSSTALICRTELFHVE